MDDKGARAVFLGLLIGPGPSTARPARARPCSRRSHPLAVWFRNLILRSMPAGSIEQQLAVVLELP